MPYVVEGGDVGSRQVLKKVAGHGRVVSIATRGVDDLR